MKYLALMVCFTALTACNWGDTKTTTPDDNPVTSLNAATGEMCGGIAGIICASDEDFCKTDMGQCFTPDGAGVCTTKPEICPTIYDPVCGCDGKTYSNQCEADKAGMNVNQMGACPS